MGDKPSKKQEEATLALLKRKVANGFVDEDVAKELAANLSVDTVQRLRSEWENFVEKKPRCGLAPDVACEFEQTLTAK